jgi:hypothetical protein
MAKTTIKMAFTKTTPGTVVYHQVDDQGKQLKSDVDGAMVPSLYIRKLALGKEVPQTLTIEINT